MPEFVLERKKDQVLIRFGSDETAQPVSFVWAKPLTGRGQEISIIDSKKKEILMIHSLADLDHNTAHIILSELEKRYFIPVITKIISISMISGDRYWTVDTDRGPRRFLMKDPNNNIISLSDDCLILRDTFGHCYEIASLRALDLKSLAEVHKII